MLEFDGDWDLRRGTRRPPSVVKETGSPWRLGLGLVFRVVAEDGYTPEDNPDPDPGLVFLPV